MATPTKSTEKPAADTKPEKIEPNPVEAGEPYPEGAGRDPEADFEAAHGYRREQKKEG